MTQALTLWVSEYLDRGLRTITIGFKGEMIAWDVKPYGKASRIDGVNVKVDPANDLIFKEINTFLHTLPVARQEKIWNTYKAIFRLFENTSDLPMAQAKLQDLVKLIYDEVTYDELRSWARMSPLIHIPVKIKAEYEPNDPVETTYIRSQYFDLLVLAIASRMMVPIWGEYITRIKDQIGATYREYEAVKLMYKSTFTRWEPYLRLYTYIEKSIDGKAKPGTIYSAIISHLSTSEFPDWLLANALVRRTSVVPLDSTGDSTLDGPNVVTDVYGYVSSTLRSTGHKRFAGSITDKEQQSDGKKDQKESFAEGYKIKQEIPDGEVVQASVYILEYSTKSMLHAIDPSFPMALYDACNEAMDRIKDRFIPSRHQITLAQWVLAPVISPRFLTLIERAALLKALCSVQALLWHWGFGEIAALVTAHGEDRDPTEFLSTQETWSKIPQDVMNELALIYPNSLQVKGKNITPRQTNPGSVAVEAMYALLSEYDWWLQCPPELIQTTRHVQGSRKMYLPTDIRHRLASLLIHLYHERIAFRNRRQAQLIDKAFSELSSMT